eukprot:g64926.t1
MKKTSEPLLASPTISSDGDPHSFPVNGSRDYARGRCHRSHCKYLHLDRRLYLLTSFHSLGKTLPSNPVKMAIEDTTHNIMPGQGHDIDALFGLTAQGRVENEMIGRKTPPARENGSIGLDKAGRPHSLPALPATGEFHQRPLQLVWRPGAEKKQKRQRTHPAIGGRDQEHGPTLSDHMESRVIRTTGSSLAIIL